MPLWRCSECRREFEADAPACEPCGLDPAKYPRDAEAFFPLVLIHFDPPTRRSGVGHNRAACDPKLKVGAPRCAFSGEPTAVNCAACKATEVFRAAGGFSNGALAMKLTK